MSKHGDVSIKLLLGLLNVIAGVALWFGYSFSSHVTTQLDRHEARIDRLEVAVGQVSP